MQTDPHVDCPKLGIHAVLRLDSDSILFSESDLSGSDEGAGSVCSQSCDRLDGDASAHSALAGIYGRRGVILFNPRLNLSMGGVVSYYSILD